jgi:hypothetical protein
MEFAAAEEPQHTTPSDPTVRRMIPEVNLPFRIGLFAVLVLLIAISPGPWTRKFWGVLLFSFLTGSFRKSFIEFEVLYVQLTVCFIPLKQKRYKLKRFKRIEIKLEEQAGWWTFFLFGPIQWVWSRFLDFAIPWFGGTYQLWLASGKKQVLVWQGCSDEDYEHNLEQLQTATGLEAVRN